VLGRPRFDKAVRRKPPWVAADAGPYANSICGKVRLSRFQPELLRHSHDRLHRNEKVTAPCNTLHTDSGLAKFDGRHRLGQPFFRGSLNLPCQPFSISSAFFFTIGHRKYCRLAIRLSTCSFSCESEPQQFFSMFLLDVPSEFSSNNTFVGGFAFGIGEWGCHAGPVKGGSGEMDPGPRPTRALPSRRRPQPAICPTKDASRLLHW